MGREKKRKEREEVEDGNYPSDDVTKAMTEVCLNILEDDIQLREEAYKAMEIIMKDAGAFPTEIREYLDGALPPEPPRPPSPRLVAELERLKDEDEAREAEAARKALEGSSSSGEEFSGELVDNSGKPKSGKPKNKMLDAVSSDSRRGSLVPPGSRRGSRQGSISLAGTERRGSYYGDDVSKRATVAVVVDGDKGNMVTVMGADGKPMQVNASALQAAGSQNNTGNMVTIMSPEGKPIQVNASALQAASAQNSMGAERSTAWNDPHQF